MNRATRLNIFEKKIKFTKKKILFIFQKGQSCFPAGGLTEDRGNLNPPVVSVTFVSFECNRDDAAFSVPLEDAT